VHVNPWPEHAEPLALQHIGEPGHLGLCPAAALHLEGDTLIGLPSQSTLSFRKSSAWFSDGGGVLRIQVDDIGAVVDRPLPRRDRVLRDVQLHLFRPRRRPGARPAPPGRPRRPQTAPGKSRPLLTRIIPRSLKVSPATWRVSYRPSDMTLTMPPENSTPSGTPTRNCALGIPDTKPSPSPTRY
jgi:hypothetical protein